MKKTFTTLVVLAFLFVIVTPIYLFAQNFSLQQQITDLRGQYSKLTDEEIAVVEAVKRSRGAVVSVVQSKEVFAPTQKLLDLGNGMKMVVPGELKSQGKKVVGQGSGFLVRADGLIATNKHVIFDKNADYQVVFNTGGKAVAKVVAMDPVNDVALLKIDAGSIPGGVLPLTLGDSKNLYVGQTVIAIGNALGKLQNSVTKGIVSATDRSIVASDSSAGQTEKLVKIIQTDAAINPGNSGGPLLSTSGEVVGINTAVNQGAENIGFAIPAEDIAFVINSYEKNGSVVRPFLGIRYVPINADVKKELKLSYVRGVLLAGGEGQPAVVSDSPAQKAGLVEGDIILSINGTNIDVDHDLASMVRNYSVGETVSLRVWQKSTKKEKVIKVKLTAMK